MTLDPSQHPDGGGPQDGAIGPEDIRAALERGEFVVHYQPKVDLRSGVVAAMEALVRWQRPGTGVVPPDRFIGIAERHGLIGQLGLYVLDKALEQAAIWERSHHRPFRVWVNVAAGQLADPVALEEAIVTSLAKWDVSAESLGLELTESSLLDNIDAAGAMLARLRRLGIQLALDDFGTGYSSLAYLRHLPVDVLKIDRSFVSGVGERLGDAAIVEAIVKLAHTLGLTVVAEGVESMSQLAELAALSADRTQGYLFSRPVPAAALDELLDLPWCGVDVTSHPAMQVVLRSIDEDLPGGGGSRSRLLLSALDALTTPVVVSDRESILYVNSAFVAETGFSPDAVVGQQYAFIDARSPETEAARDLFYERSQLGQPLTLEVLALRADGSTYPCSVALTPVMNATGGVSHWLSLRRDLSGERELDRLMEHQLAMRQLTGRFAATCLSHAPEDPLSTQELSGLVHEVASLLGAHRCFIDQVDLDEQRVVTTAVTLHEGGEADSVPQWEERAADLLAPLHEVPLWQVMMDRGAVLVSRPGRGPLPDWVEEQRRITGRRPGSQVIAPMRVNGRTYGAIGVAMGDDEDRVWRADEIDFIRTLAEAAANLSDRCRVFRSAETRLSMSEFQLQLSETVQSSRGTVADTLPEILAGLTAHLGVGLAFLDIVDDVTGEYRVMGSHRAGNVTPVEDGQELTGEIAPIPFDPGHPWFARLATLEPLVIEDTEREAELMSQHPSDATIGRGRSYLYVPFAVDGKLFGVLGLGEATRPRQWADFEIRSLRVVAGILAGALERERVQSGLKASEERFRLLAETAADLILVSNWDGEVTYASPSSRELLGRGPDELIGSGFFSMVHPDDVDKARGFRQQLRSQDRVASEVRLLHADGAWRWCASSMRAVRDAQGEPVQVHASIRDVSHLRELQDELAARATTDELTGVANRAELQRRLDDDDLPAETALMLIDLDGFKAINDRYGHLVGDRVLQAVAERLSRIVRSGDVVARYGGDEFVVLCRGMTVDEALNTAQRIVDQVAVELVIEGHELSIGVSVGVALAAADPQRADEAGQLSASERGAGLVRRADAAMYDAKRAGKGQVRLLEAATPEPVGGT